MTDSFAAALAKLQADLPPIPRSRRGQAGNRTYKYPPYDAILAKVRPVLHKHGFVWHTQPDLANLENGQARFVLAYTLTHLPSGGKATGLYPLTEGAAQAQGSQISYAKRYALVAVLDLVVVGEDDDGQATSARAPGPFKAGDVLPSWGDRPLSASEAADLNTRERIPAKVTGAEHERLRYGTVEATPEDRPAERGPDPNDHWADQPPGQFDIGQPEDRPGSVDARQLKDIGIAFGKAGIADRSVRLGIVADLVGRELLTSKQLSRLEADHVLKALSRGGDTLKAIQAIRDQEAQS